MDLALHMLALSLIGGLVVAEVAFEDGAEPAASPVQEHALIRFAQIERGAHVRRRPSMDITQCDDRSLGARKVLERASQDRQRLAIEGCAFGPHRPWLRRGRPMARPLRMTRR